MKSPAMDGRFWSFIPGSARAGLVLHRSGDQGRSHKSMSAVDINEPQKLRARPRVVAEGAQHLAGDHRHAALVHAARGHALVRGVDHHTDSTRIEDVVDAGG